MGEQFAVHWPDGSSSRLLEIPEPSTTGAQGGSEPIRGTIGEPEGATVAFTGWMELAAVHARGVRDAGD